MRVWWFLIVGLISVAGSASATAQVEDEITRMGRGLRSRQLFDLAIEYCRLRGGDPELDPTRQSIVALEEMKTWTAKAALSRDGERETLWQSALEVADKFRQSHPNHPRQLLIDVQSALTWLARGRTVRLEWEADLLDPAQQTSAREQAIESLRQALAQFRQAQRAIEELLPRQRGRQLTEHELDTDELTALSNNLTLQMAITQLNRALLTPRENRIDRIDALDQVAKRLDEVRRVSAPEDPIWWEVQFARIECERLRDQPVAAREILTGLPLDEATSENRQRALEEKILLSLSGAKLPVDAILAEAEPIVERIPELDVALVRLLKAASDRADDPATQEQWLLAAEQQTRRTESQHGGYWGRRAELILLGNADNRTAPRPSSNAGMAQAAIRERVGDEAVRDADWDLALRAYDEAAAAATQNSDQETGTRVGIKAARVCETQNQHAAAAERFLKVATGNPSSPLAAASHLRGCWNLARLNTQPAQEAFRERLREHLVTWPDAETADQARVWLAGRLFADGQWRQTIELALKITQPAQIETACDLLSAASARLRNETLAANQSLKEPETELWQKIGGRLETYLADLGGNWDDPARKLLILRCQLGLPHQLERPESLARELAAASEQAEGSLRPRLAASMLAALALAESADFDDDPWWDRLIAEPSAWREAARSWNELARLSSQPTVRLQTARERLAGLGREQEGEADEKAFWAEQLAEAREGLARDREAVEAWRDLVQLQPKSARAQQQLARALTRLGDDSSRAEALNLWRRLATQTTPKSESWFEAKYYVASLLRQTGDDEAALKMLQYLRAIPPGWSESRWKSKFDELLQSLEQ